MAYNRPDLAVKVNLFGQKGYTMKEIGSLEKRIKNLEYYTVLNALALDTQTTSVVNSDTKLERFKNGIFADPFNDSTLCRDDSELRISISPINSMARPYFYNIYDDFQLAPTSSNVKATGRLLTLDYTSEFMDGNPFATGYRNCTDSYYSFNGRMILFPSIYMGIDSEDAAPQTITIDNTIPFQSAITAGAFQNIDTTQGTPTIINSDYNHNYWSQSVTQTITDISITNTLQTTFINDNIVDVSQLSYMSAKTISVCVKGVRPNTRIYPYFDNTDISSYCAPATVASTYATNGSLDHSKITQLSESSEAAVLTQSGTLGSSLTSNSKGEVYFLFYLPSKTFRTGDRTLLVLDVDSLSSISAATSQASARYTSSSLSVTHQQTSFNILQPVFAQSVTAKDLDPITWTTDIYHPPQNNGGGGGGGGGSKTVDWWGNDPNDPSAGSFGFADSDFGADTWGGCGYDPIAQTFTVGNSLTAGLPGIYLTQIGVYFKRKDNIGGISILVAETTAGYPDANKILSTGHLLSSGVSISDDSSSETVFVLDEPIFLAANKTYAFWLAPDNNSPDYLVYTSTVGQADIVTGNYISKQPYAGILYGSSDGISWTPYQTQDMKFKLYRAKFNSFSGTAVFRNTKREYLSINNIYRKTSGNPIRPGDVVYAANATNLTSFLTSNNQIFPFGIVDTVDEVNQYVYLRDTNGKFDTSAMSNIRFFRVPDITDTVYINSANLVANATVTSVDNPLYHGLVPKFTVSTPFGTFLDYNFFGTANSTYSFAKDTVSTVPTIEKLYEFRDYERVIRSYSNELSTGTYGANGTATYVINMATNNIYLTPMINLNSKIFNYIRNDINNDSTNEYTRYGNARTKYVSKIVTLDNYTEDLRVYLSAYKPAGTDLEVYAKFYNPDRETDGFDNKLWTKLSYIENTDVLRSSLGKYGDIKELIFGLPTSAATTLASGQTTAYADLTVAAGVDDISTGTLTYKDQKGNVIRGYKQFSIKIVFLSDNPVNYPFVNDVRAMALMI